MAMQAPVNGSSPNFPAPQTPAYANPAQGHAAPTPSAPCTGRYPVPDAGAPAQPYYVPPYVPAAAKPKAPFHAKRADAVFALLCLAFGFLFVRWFLPLEGWGVSAFVLLWVLSVLLYARAEGVRPEKESWFWFSLLILTGLSFSLWPGGSMWFWRGALCFGLAIYWCGCLFGVLLCKKTGNWLPLDAVNLLFPLPFKNYLLLPKSLSRPGKEPGESAEEGQQTQATRRKIYGVVLGLLLCIPLLALLLPLLLDADGGQFAALFSKLFNWIKLLFKDELIVYFLQFIFGIPVAFYICGLVAGSAHKRHVNNIDGKKVERAFTAARVVPVATAATVLAVVSLLYVVFIACQLPYYFSAFVGLRPEGYGVYSAYAREGFFELCRVAGINFVLMAVCGIFGRKRVPESKLLRVFVLLLAGLTLLLVLTAFSKMMLYIGAYGLTPLRLQTSVFMVFLFLLCLAVGVLQFKRFSIVRFAAFLGSAMLCALCLCNVDGLSASYNAERYINGSLPTYDATGLGDIVSAEAALRALEEGRFSPAERSNLALSMEVAEHAAQTAKGRSWDNVSSALLREKDWRTGFYLEK